MKPNGRVKRDAVALLHIDGFPVFRKLLMRCISDLSPTYKWRSSLLSKIRQKDFASLYEEVDSLSVQQYSDPHEHFAVSQISQLVKKYPWPKGVMPFDPETTALNSFLDSEASCQAVNQRFSSGKIEELIPSLEKMRSFIRYVLGDTFSNREWFRSCEFGSGASLGIHGSATHLGRKISEKWTVSSPAYPFALACIRHHHQLVEEILPSKSGYVCYDLGESERLFQDKTDRREYNKISFVPKTAKTHRGIAVEPTLNGYLQKGIDKLIRQRLKRVGINLQDQTVNQRLAREGSVRGSSEDTLATIDLKSASDSISIELVRYLVPDAWFDRMWASRSHAWFHSKSKTSVPYQKFCSMGNGFCFPLETLIFTAACHAVGCKNPGVDYHVYGDDIIAPARLAPALLELLKEIGFTPNPAKTFISGSFRESCGADWYNGLDVRPYTLDYTLDSLQNIFKFLNLSTRNELTRSFFSSTRFDILKLVPEKFMFVRPFPGNPDTGIDSIGTEFMTSRHCFFNRRKQHWEWHEIRASAIPDKGFYRKRQVPRRETFEVYSALSGVGSNHHGKPKFVYRRKTKTIVVLTGHGGATSMWLPETRSR